MDWSEATPLPLAPGDTPGKVRGLSTMGGRKSTHAEKDTYIPQRCASHDLVMDEDLLQESAPSFNIGSADPEHKQYVLQGIIARSRAAIQESREDPHYIDEIPTGAEYEYTMLH